MKAKQSVVLAEKGSSATLECDSPLLHSFDSSGIWKFKGVEIEENTNKKTTSNYSAKKVYLHIANVSESDFGTYACFLQIRGGNRPYQKFIQHIELKLLEKRGEFHLLLFLLYRLH